MNSFVSMPPLLSGDPADDAKALYGLNIEEARLMWKRSQFSVERAPHEA